MHMDVARAVNRNRLLHLVFQIAQIRHRRRGDVRNICAIAISGTLLPCPKTLPGFGPTEGVVAVRAAAASCSERCTPVFMYASLS